MATQAETTSTNPLRPPHPPLDPLLWTQEEIERSKADLEIGHFDWRQCADLHNRILDIGWDAVRKDTSWQKDHRSWWQWHFGDEIPASSSEGDGDVDEEPEEEPEEVVSEDLEELELELERRLAPEVVQFLKSAQFDNPGEDGNEHFFYHMKGLSSPDALLETLDAKQDGRIPWSEKDRYLMLYTANLVSINESIGIIFDQRTMFAITVIDAGTKDGYAGAMRIPAVWVPLQDILLAFVDMVTQKHIEAVSVYKQAGDGEDAYFSPWRKVPGLECAVQRTLVAWENLLLAIEQRIPEGSVIPDSRLEDYSTSVVEAVMDDESFERQFLQRARKPRFSFVAPGLRFPLPSELSSQPFKDSERLRGPVNRFRRQEYPILFLRFDSTLVRSQYQFAGYPWSMAEQVETGLYLKSRDTRPDGCRLILPSPIGDQGWARFGDGLRLVEDFDSGAYRYNRYDGLYQPGFNQLCPKLQVRLALVFERWLRNIELGDWTVGENGVAGGMEKFTEADTEAGWGKYWIPRTW